jgi:hypothetical protein
MTIKHSKKDIARWNIKHGTSDEGESLEVESDSSSKNLCFTVCESYPLGMFDCERNRASVNLSFKEAEELCKVILERIRELEE